MRLRKNELPVVSPHETIEFTDQEGSYTDIVSQDQTLAGSIDRVSLVRAIDALPPGYRIIFVPHDIEGYEHREIAELLVCCIGNSKSQPHKARLTLRDLLKRWQGSQKEEIQQKVTMRTKLDASGDAAFAD